MSTIKDTTVTISGLSTLGNQLSGKNGSLNDCDNIVLRRPGTLEPAPYILGGEVPYTATATTVVDPQPVYATSETVTPFVSVWSQGQNTVGTGKYWLSVYDLDAAKSYIYGNVTESTALSTTRNFFLTPGDAQSSWSRNRRLYSTDRGCLAWTRNTADTNYELRLAGMPPPKGIRYVSSVVGTPGIMPTNGAVAYRATLLRKHVDYALESGVTPAVIVRTVLDLNSVTLHATFDSQLDVRAGDICVLYRTAGVNDPDTNNPADPGDDMQEATRATITATDLTNGFVALTDTNLSSSLGASLYTSKEGLAQNNYTPPNAHDVCTFGDTAFYAMTQDYPTMSFSMPNVGYLPDGASVGWDTWNMTTTVANATTGTVPGDVRGSIEPGMIIIAEASPPSSSVRIRISAVSYNGVNTVLTFASGGYSGYQGLYPAAAGTRLIHVFDAWYFTFNEYDGSTTSSLFMLPTNGVDEVYGMPAEKNAMLASDKGLRRIGIASFDVVTRPAPSGQGFTLKVTIRMTQPAGFKSFSMSATHGGGYMGMDSYTSTVSPGPPVYNWTTAFKASTQSTDKSIVYYSKSQLPESVPPGNFFPVGHGEIQRLFTDQNSLYAACTDGLYRITGVGNDWTVVQLSKTFRLVTKNAVTQCLGTPFVWARDGISVISESGPKNVSSDSIGPALWEAGSQFTPNIVHSVNEWGPYMTGDDSRQEITLQLSAVTVSPSTGGAGITTSYGGPYILNLTSQGFYKRSQIQSAAAVYQAKWQATFYFNRDLSNVSTIFWEERPSEDVMDHSKYPVRTPSAVTRKYPNQVFWIFNPFKAQASILKQWVDCNILVRKQTGDGEISYDAGPDGLGNWVTIINDDGLGANAFMRFLFSSNELSFGTLANARNWQYATSLSVSRLHSYIPRRTAVSDTLIVGCQIVPAIFTKPANLVGLPNAISYPMFRCEGFTLRYRISSDTFQV